MSAIDLKPFPRWPLYAAFCLVGISILGATVARFSRMEAPTLAMQTEAAMSKAVSVRTLSFVAEAGPNGPIAVVDPATRQTIATLNPDTDGFIHGIMRGLRRSRMVRAAPLDPTLTIASWSDGRITVTDPATDTMLDLRAFGVDNKAAFARFLPTPTPAPAQTAPAAPTQTAKAGP